MNEKNFPTIDSLHDFNTIPTDVETFYQMEFNLVNMPDESGEEPFEDIEEHFL